MDELEAWRRRVREALPGFFAPLEVAASLPTTMARAAELAAAGSPEGTTVLAEEQTAGRGRLGRTWVAPPGSSLLLSVVLRPALPREAVWLTVAAAGVALAGAVEAVAPGAAQVGLKWPNDLELGGRKAAGLLAEAHLDGERLRWVVLGMGVNVTQEAGDLPAEVADRATSVAIAAGGPVNRAGLLAAWAERFLAGYQRLTAGEPGPLLAAYRERLVTLGRRVRADRVGAEPLVGTAVDLTGTGGLVIRTDAGAGVELLAGDVRHLRPAPPA